MGNFCKGDIVEIINNKNEKLGKGISYYDSVEIKKNQRKKSIFIKEILGYEGREEVVQQRLFIFRDMIKKVTEKQIFEIGKKAKTASRLMGQISKETKNKMICEAAKNLT